jgi:hypothetical protein
MQITGQAHALSWQHHGYSIPYRVGESNHCPGCSRQNWIVGRLMAECAFCGTALALTDVHGFGAVQTFSGRQYSPEWPDHY